MSAKHVKCGIYYWFYMSSLFIFSTFLFQIHLRKFDGTLLSASYLSLHRMPTLSVTQPEEGSVSYFNQREKFVKIS